MRLLSLILLSIFALCVVAAPTDFELHSALAIPVPNSTTYDADLAAAVAHARSHPSSSVKMSATDAQTRRCGWYRPIPHGPYKPVYTTGLLLCGETDPGEEMKFILNFHCGFCVVFDEHQCQGNILWNGGPSTPPMELPADKSHAVPGGKSYFCY